MPKFYFHVEGFADDLGVDLPSIDAAKCEAARYAGRLLCDEAVTFWGMGEMSLTVTDERGLSLFVLSISGTEAPAIRIVPVVPA